MHLSYVCVLVCILNEFFEILSTLLILICVYYRQSNCCQDDLHRKGNTELGLAVLLFVCPNVGCVKFHQISCDGRCLRRVIAPHFRCLSPRDFIGLIQNFVNLLTPNVNYSGRTAPLTSKVAFYIFIQQI